jgi:glutamyl endopeptidase
MSLRRMLTAVTAITAALVTTIVVGGVAGEFSPAEAQEGAAIAAAGDLVASDGSTITIPGGGFAPWEGDGYEGTPVPELRPEAARPLAPGTSSPQTQDGLGTESVIGPDGRTQVTNTTDYPNRAIGQVTFFQGGSSYICTGYLIDPNTVATSGHCVNQGGQGALPTAWSTGVAFSPARNGGSYPFGSCGATNLVTTQGWLDGPNEYYDLGFIQLDCTIGTDLGWFGVFAAADVDLLNQPETIRGYPGDKGGTTMWTMDDQVRALESLMVYYQSDTAGGQSGSPVYRTSPADCVGYCAMGTHGYGTHGFSPHNANNHAPRITADRFDEFLAVGAANCENHQFLDIPPWIEDAADWIACERYMTGFARNLFDPYASITRGQTARQLYRIAGEPPVGGLPPHNFTDVPPWLERPVRWLAGNDYATGYDGDLFKPDDNITRAAVSRMQFRIAGPPPESPPNGFSDVPDWADAAVDWIVDPANSPQYATGFAGNVFKSMDDINRAQTARMNCRINSPDPC